MSDVFLDEVISYAERYLEKSGVDPRGGKRPEAVKVNHTTDSMVDYVSRTNTLVFSNVDEFDAFHLDQDTIKLLGRIYSGLKDNFSFDSENHNSFRVAMDMLPEDWEVPFDSMDLGEPEELRLASELWRRRGDRIEPVIDALREQTDDFQDSYDKAAEPIDEFSRMVAPEEDAPLGIITDYMNSDVKKEVIENLFAGREKGIENMEKHNHRIYQKAKKNDYSKEEVERKMDEVRDAVPEVREEVERLDRAEEYLIGALEWEIEKMLESESPEPMDVATAYMLEPLVNGTLDQPSMHENVEDYIELIRNEEGEQEYRAAKMIFDRYRQMDPELEPTERFRKAVEEKERR